MKIIIPMAAGLLGVHASITSLSNVCDWDGYVTTKWTFTPGSGDQLLDILAGKCSSSEYAPTTETNPEDDTATDYTFRYKAADCFEDPDHYSENSNGLPPDSLVNIRADNWIGDHEMLLRSHTIISRCEFKSSYKAVFDFGNIDLKSEDNGNVIDTGSLGFGLQVYKDDTRETEFTDDFFSGEMAYAKIRIISGSLPSGGSYAPSKCVFTEETEGETYQLFPYEDTCGGSYGDNLSFAINYDSASDSWHFQYRLFLFSKTATDTRYKLECDIDLCKAGFDADNNPGTSACRATADFCAPDDADNF